jgi:hypothetical protein
VATFDAVGGKTYIPERLTNLAAAWSNYQTIGPVTDSGPITVGTPSTRWGPVFSGSDKRLSVGTRTANTIGLGDWARLLCSCHRQ